MLVAEKNQETGQEKKQFCTEFSFPLPRSFFHPSSPEQNAQSLRPTDVEKYSLKNSHESLSEEILLYYKNHVSPTHTPIKRHDIHGRS